MAGFLVFMAWIFLMMAWMNAIHGTSDKFFVLEIVSAMICALWVGFERLVWAIKQSHPDSGGQ